MGKGWKVVGGLGLVLVAVGFWSKSVVVIVLGIVLTLVGERQGARSKGKARAARGRGDPAGLKGRV